MPKRPIQMRFELQAKCPLLSTDCENYLDDVCVLFPIVWLSFIIGDFLTGAVPLIRNKAGQFTHPPILIMQQLLRHSQYV